MESVPETRSRSPEERKVEWARLEQIGGKLDNAALTRTEIEELMDVLIDNKDLFCDGHVTARGMFVIASV